MRSSSRYLFSITRPTSASSPPRTALPPAVTSSWPLSAPAIVCVTGNSAPHFRDADVGVLVIKGERVRVEAHVSFKIMIPRRRRPSFQRGSNALHAIKHARRRPLNRLLPRHLDCRLRRRGLSRLRRERLSQVGVRDVPVYFAFVPARRAAFRSTAAAFEERRESNARDKDADDDAADPGHHASPCGTRAVYVGSRDGEG